MTQHVNSRENTLLGDMKISVVFTYVKVKVKFDIEQTIKAHAGSRCIALPFL
jgi:hypothetical protein